MKESNSFKIKNDLSKSRKAIRKLDKDGKELSRFEYEKSDEPPAGTYFKFTTDPENEPVNVYFEIHTDGSFTFSPKSLSTWRRVKIKMKKDDNTGDETVNVTIGEDRDFG